MGAPRATHPDLEQRDVTTTADWQPLGSSYVYDRATLLGEGTIGFVHPARPVDGDGADLAVKLLRNRWATDADVRYGLLAESASLRSLDHPNVVQVLDVVAEGDRLAIVMPRVDGTDLATWAETRGPLPPALAVAAARQVLEALAAVHAEQLVHLDVKPGNVLVEEQPDGGIHLRLSDFGLAQRVESASDTQLAALWGTAAYFAPERFRRTPPTAASDVYAAGVLLYELVTGSLPFGDDDPEQVITRHQHAAPPRPPSMDPELWDLVDRLLAKQPDERPTAAEAAGALAGLAPGLIGRPPEPPFTPTAWESVTTRTTNVEALAAATGAPAAAPGEVAPVASVEAAGGASDTSMIDRRIASATGPIRSEPMTEPPAPRRRWLAWAAGALVLVAGVVGLVALFTSGEDAPEPAAPVGGRIVATGTQQAPSGLLTIDRTYELVGVEDGTPTVRASVTYRSRGTDVNGPVVELVPADITSLSDESVVWTTMPAGTVEPEQLPTTGDDVPWRLMLPSDGGDEITFEWELAGVTVPDDPQAALDEAVLAVGRALEQRALAATASDDALFALAARSVSLTLPQQLVVIGDHVPFEARLELPGGGSVPLLRVGADQQVDATAVLDRFGGPDALRLRSTGGCLDDSGETFVFRARTAGTCELLPDLGGLSGTSVRLTVQNAG